MDATVDTVTDDIAALQAELAAVERQIAALHARSDFDPDADFALKTEIGGIRSESRRVKRLRRERWDREAEEASELLRRKVDLENRIAGTSRTSHGLGREVVEAMVTAVLRAMLRPEDRVWAGDYRDIATVVRVNTKTVSVRLPSGMTDRLPFLAIRPLEWERMRAEYKQQRSEDRDADTN